MEDGQTPNRARADQPVIFAMAAPGAGARPLPRFLTVSLATELGVLLALSLMFPFMIHLLPFPEESRLGPRLLPMFYAPLLAALLGRKQSAVGVALLAPWLNWALTSHPAPRMAWVMTLQLMVFVVALMILLRRVGPRWFLALPAYLVAMLASAALVALVPTLNCGRPPGPWLINSIGFALPGIAVLLLINWLAVRMYPTAGGDGGPAATA